uniref:Uncharacterized protein n=1 Tax=Timema douglasi TaxID=61478 RepID=A0A7R8VN43_TIMDO|nr:unnamed protein product [Timema douglasi]
MNKGVRARCVSELFLRVTRAGDFLSHLAKTYYSLTSRRRRVDDGCVAAARTINSLKEEDVTCRLASNGNATLERAVEKTGKSVFGWRGRKASLWKSGT